MLFSFIKTDIEQKNVMLQNGTVTEEQYALWKEGYQIKIAVFWSSDKITQEQYENLMSLLT